MALLNRAHHSLRRRTCSGGGESRTYSRGCLLPTGQPALPASATEADPSVGCRTNKSQFPKKAATKAHQQNKRFECVRINYL